MPKENFINLKIIVDSSFLCAIIKALYNKYSNKKESKMALYKITLVVEVEADDINEARCLAAEFGDVVQTISVDGEVGDVVQTIVETA